MKIDISESQGIIIEDNHGNKVTFDANESFEFLQVFESTIQQSTQAELEKLIGRINGR